MLTGNNIRRPRHIARWQRQKGQCTKCKIRRGVVFYYMFIVTVALLPASRTISIIMRKFNNLSADDALDMILSNDRIDDRTEDAPSLNDNIEKEMRGQEGDDGIDDEVLNNIINDVNASAKAHNGGTSTGDQTKSPNRIIDTQIEDLNHSDTCTAFQNSKEWLTGPRLSNIDESLMTDNLIENLIINISPLDTIDGSRHVLEQQSMCLNDSSFMNWKPPNLSSRKRSANSGNPTIDHIAFTLMFYALHEHQYGPARAEAISRYAQQSKDCDGQVAYFDSLKKAEVGRFDFECRDTKYIVAPVSFMGYGAVIRTSMIDKLLLGLASNRVVLFINSIDSAPLEYMTREWPLASCPRKDLQCMHMPLSPCVITQDDLDHGLVLGNNEYKNFRHSPEIYNSEKVVILNSIDAMARQHPKGLADAFVNIIQSLYSKHQGDSRLRLESKLPWHLDEKELLEVYEYILDERQGMWWVPNQAAVFYLTRPNIEARVKIDEAMNKIFPPGFDPNSAIGLPIRGTDKCDKTEGNITVQGEAECFPFDKYTEIALGFKESRIKKLREQGKNPNLDKIILTSEDRKMIEGRLALTLRNESFPFEFIVNKDDPLQGTGSPKSFSSESSDADHVILASMVSLKMQLHSESILLNRCSNFHKLMTDMIIHGCGAQRYYENLQENNNPEFRLQCRWSN